MAAVPITIFGALTRADGTTEQVTIQGMASLTGLGVGGGPILPDDKPPSHPGRPTFPIWGPPGSNFPDKPGYPPVVGGGPIIPPPPVDPPIDIPPDVPPPSVGVKPPPPNGGWAYVSTWGWGYFPMGSTAGPK